MRPARHRLPAAAALAAVLLCGCRPSSPPIDSVATYRGGEVARAMYESWLSSRRVADNPATRQAEIEAMLLAEDLAARAIGSGLDRRPLMIREIRVAQDRYRANLLRDRVMADVAVEDAEVEAAFVADPTAFDTPGRVELRHIFRRVPPGTTPERVVELRQETDKLREELAAGDDFAEAARRSSDSESRFRGGYMGPIEPRKLRAEVAAVAVGLVAGEVSEVIATPDGFTILKCVGTEVAVVLDAAAARARHREKLAREKGVAAWRELHGRLLVDAAVAIDMEAALDSATPPATAVVRYTGGQLDRDALRDLLQAMGVGGALERREMDNVDGAVNEAVLMEKAAAMASTRGLDADAASDLAWLRRQRLALEQLRELIGRELEPATEQDLRDRFMAHRDAYVRSAQYSLDAIELDPALGRRERFELGERLVTELRGGRAFDDAAREFSRHESRDAGGDLGWLGRERLATFGPNILAAITAARPGTIEDPVWQDGNLWILRLRAIRPEAQLSFEEARAAVERDLEEERWRAATECVEGRLRRELRVVLR